MHKNSVADFDADIILVGGDVSYDNNFATCFYCYDHLMKRLPYLRNNLGVDAIKVIPFIFAVGNHDLGINAYSGRNLSIDENDSRPVFKHYYPQNTHMDGIPDRVNRRTFYSKRFGNSYLILSLDTGYERFNYIEFTENK